MIWQGVMPAMTTSFDGSGHVDHTFMAEHCRWLIDNGCTGIVALGSLGEGATLTFQEKVAILRNLRTSLPNVPLVAAISALSTGEAVDLARAARDENCDGLMVLPPYVYKSDWYEMKTHIGTVFGATSLSCMLYNNPIAYGTDFLPEQIVELATEYPNFQAVKESSADVRRVAAIRALLGNRLDVFVGVDDAIVEAISVGAKGWIAGLANALPRESAELFLLASQGHAQKAFELYKWFLPLLRMDTVVKFVQLIKLVQEEVGMGNSRVRPPRLLLEKRELEEARRIIRDAMGHRPHEYASQPVSTARS
jgi:dihydrodipicolinate synthase/N-acetylneuraminate lyase